MNFLSTAFDFVKSAFVSTRPEPVYQVLSKTSINEVEFEIRLYPSQQWVSTKVNVSNSAEALKDANTTLSDFFKEHKLHKTQPAVARRCHHEDMDNYTVSLMMPEREEDSKVPDSEVVEKESWYKQIVYVMTFSGRADKDDWKNKLNEFTNTMDNSEFSYIKNLYACVEYDAPQKLLFRKNQVWLFREFSVSSASSSVTLLSGVPEDDSEEKDIRSLHVKSQVTWSSSTSPNGAHTPNILSPTGVLPKPISGSNSPQVQSEEELENEPEKKIEDEPGKKSEDELEKITDPVDEQKDQHPGKLYLEIDSQMSEESSTLPEK